MGTCLGCSEGRSERALRSQSGAGLLSGCAYVPTDLRVALDPETRDKIQN